MPTPKNTICLWSNRDAEEASRFYATVFPASEVKSVFTLISIFSCAVSRRSAL